MYCCRMRPGKQIPKWKSGIFPDTGDLHTIKKKNNSFAWLLWIDPAYSLFLKAADVMFLL